MQMSMRGGCLSDIRAVVTARFRALGLDDMHLCFHIIHLCFIGMQKMLESPGGCGLVTLVQASPSVKPTNE